jgi:hypothetical protein
VAPCSRQHLFAAAVTALLWVSSLLTFALAHAAAQCGGARSASLATTVATAAVALALGAGACGLASDRMGRAATLRLALVVGALACAAAVAARPEDAEIVLALVAAAGAAAGGSHVAATLLLELVRRRYRASVLLSFPALFFPVALVQRGIEAAGWARAAAATLLVCAVAGAGLLCLPESPAFLKARAEARAATGAGAAENYDDAAADASAAAMAAADAPKLDDSAGASETLKEEEEEEVEVEEHLSSQPPPPGFGLGDAVLTPAAERRERLRRCGARLRVERGTAITAALWLLVTPVIYLTAMVSYLLPGSGMGGGGEAAARGANSDAARLCAARAEPLFGSAVAAATAATAAAAAAATVIPRAAEASSAAAGVFVASNATVLAPVCIVAEPVAALYSLGLHVVSAELLALLLCALLLASRAIGTRMLLAASLGASALALVLAAAASHSFGCDGDVTGSLARAAVEFLTRLTLSLAAQALFLRTLEGCAVGVRGRAAGAAVALFRLGALLTLAAGSNDQRQALMWSLPGLAQPMGLLFGLSGGSVEHTAAATAVLAACSQACFLGACLASCLPADVKWSAKEEGEEEEEEEVEAEEAAISAQTGICGCLRARLLGRGDAVQHRYAPIGAASGGLETPAEMGRFGGFGSAAAAEAAAAEEAEAELASLAPPPSSPRPPHAAVSPEYLARVFWRHHPKRSVAPPLDEALAGHGVGDNGGNGAAHLELTAAQREDLRLRLLLRMAARRGRAAGGETL